MSQGAPLKLWRNARIATCDESARVLEHGAIATIDGRIEWIGEESALPAALHARVSERIDLANRWVTPGLIDCHTHLVFAGTRA